MQKYKIKIEYKTGSSLETHEEIDFLELDFDSIEIAKENLQYIKDHYLMYKELNSYFNKKFNENILNEHKDKPWFVLKYDSYNKIEQYTAEYTIRLKLTKDIEIQIHCFWYSYFEHLISAEIVSNNTDMKIEF
jgi:hypothetical protein